MARPSEESRKRSIDLLVKGAVNQARAKGDATPSESKIRREIIKHAERADKLQKW